MARLWQVHVHILSSCLQATSSGEIVELIAINFREKY
jgi:hypothetical protein